MSSLDGKNRIDHGNHMRRPAAETHHVTPGISRSELLLLLNAFHERLDGYFEDLRTLPHTAARLKARNGHPAVSERGLRRP